MRLLITTQAVDLDDPVLAFFHRWIEEFAKNADSVEVICLKEGRHALPKNVTVHSLGKEGGRSVLKYIGRFYKYSWTLRKRYDAVFVHMNPEYLVLGGLLWTLLRKRVGLWYIHPRSTLGLRYGMLYARVILSATAKSFPLKSKKIVPVGHGVDTDFFAPGDMPLSNVLRIMCAARIAPVKRLECMIDATAELVKRRTPVLFDYYGEELPRDAAYAKKMRTHAESVGAWSFRGRATQEQIRDAYRTHDAHVNATDTGSFDKAVFESMACGTITVASNKALEEVLPRELMFDQGDPLALAKVLGHIAQMSQADRGALSARLREVAVQHYSLSALIGKILDPLMYA